MNVMKMSATRSVRCFVTARIPSRTYFTDNLGCVIGSEPDRSAESFKVRRIFSDLLLVKATMAGLKKKVWTCNLMYRSAFIFSRNSFHEMKSKY